jgi:hypothetical protein
MPCDSPIYVMPKAGTEKLPVPCGRCPPCKQRRVNSWVFRMMQEQKQSLHSHFVTLTYDTRFVPISTNGFMTLKKADFQNFMKALRRRCPDATLKYYAVGEYGTHNKRPHYHAIIYNCPDKSAYLDAWDKGTVHVGDVTNDSAAYCMKYMDKPGSDRKFARDDRELEFPLMSKGIGKNYLTPEIIAYHQADVSRMYITKPGGHKIALPRYYREQIYDKQQKKQQRKLIELDAVKREAVDKQEHSITAPNMTYDDWQASKKYARHHNFYNRLKSRNV